MNMLIPRGGTGLIAGYLKLRRGIPLSDFGAVQLLPLFIVPMMCVGLAGLLAQALLIQVTGEAMNWPIAIIFAVALVGCLVVCLIPWPREWTSRFVIAQFVLRVSSAFRAVNSDPRLLGYSIVIALAAALLRAARLHLAFIAIGVRPNFLAVCIASLLSDLMVAISITPAALGFREAAIVYARQILRTTPDLALSAAVLDRLVVAGCNIAFAQIGMLRYIRARRPGSSAPTPP
jgi:uncharacterized membrane protein YbhN (UPF0104 family)